MMKRVVLGIMVTVLPAVGCHQSNEVVETGRPRISMTFSNLPHLQAGEGNYQLWATFMIFSKSRHNDSPQHDSTAVSLGEFNISEDGQNLIALDGNPMRFTIPTDQNPQLIDDIILTIQEEGHGLAKTQHGEPGPAFLGGKVHGDAAVGVADLDGSYSHALGSSFSNVSGKYTIVAPTSPADSNSGVWFIQQGTDSIGLRNLPALPPGWGYEGWIGQYSTPAPGPGFYEFYSTGKFSRADSSDYDGAGASKGAGQGLRFPGQDFITGANGTPIKPNLTDTTFALMITVEPVPDNSPRPSSLTILTTIPSGPSRRPQGQALSMNNSVSSSFPQARVTIVRSGY